MRWYRASICLPPERMQLTTGDVDRFIQQYVFPGQFVLGVLGNLVNLFVLLSTDMRSTANDLLAAMACADLALLFCMLPHSLSAFDIFAENYSFRYGYYLTKTHLAAFANCFSAATTWIILAVSIERLLGIRSPMHTRFYWKRWQMYSFVLCIFVASAALTFHHHLAYDCSFYCLCNDTQLYAQYLAIASEWPHNRINPYSQLRQQYLRLSTASNVLFVVIIPMVLVTAFNISLIRALKSHELPRRSFATVSGASFRLQQERKVTVTVFAIVTCFILTHGPSAILFTWELIIDHDQTILYLSTLFAITNSLAVTGSVLNFVLFCLSSAHYRRRLRRLLDRYRPIKCFIHRSIYGHNSYYRSTSGLGYLSGLHRQSTRSRHHPPETQRNKASDQNLLPSAP